MNITKDIEDINKYLSQYTIAKAVEYTIIINILLTISQNHYGLYRRIGILIYTRDQTAFILDIDNILITR